jgi:hypothetical protein
VILSDLALADCFSVGQRKHVGQTCSTLTCTTPNNLSSGWLEKRLLMLLMRWDGDGSAGQRGALFIAEIGVGVILGQGLGIRMELVDILGRA